MSFIQITELPEWLGKCKNLQRLYLHGTEIRELPESVGECKNLQSLNLKGTKITELPEWLGACQNLQNLDLAYCNLDSLPGWVTRLDVKAEDGWNSWDDGINLYKTTLTKQPISLFFQPKELIEAYYDAKKVMITDAKVIFLGDAEVGKSYTIKRILNGGKKESLLRRYVTRMTPGVSIKKYEKKDSQGRLDLSFWDFGGQEIMHSMHHCFLTERSCYVVMVSTRGEPMKQARKWLKSIESFAPNSPVILVVNRWDDAHNSGVQENKLKKKFSKLVELVELSVKHAEQEEFLQKVMDPIEQQARELDSYGMEFPIQWERIRNALLNMKHQKQHYIDKNQFYQICRQYGEQNQEICKWLLEWFNDLGVCFSYHLVKSENGIENELADYKVLNPEWLTNAIYVLLLNGRAFTSTGVVLHTRIRKLLKETKKGTLKGATYRAEECEYILEIMRKFGLSYPVSEEEELIPALCPDQIGEYQIPSSYTKKVSYKFEYTYLPEGIIHRLMIDCYHLLQLEYCWNKGIHLDLKEEELYVIIDGSKDEPEIRIDFYMRETEHPWKEFALLWKCITDINRQMNLSAVEYIIMQKGKEEDAFRIDKLLEKRRQNTQSYVSGNITYDMYDIDDILDVAVGLENLIQTERLRKREREEQEQKWVFDELMQQLIESNENIAYVGGKLIRKVTQGIDALHENTKAVQENTSAQSQVRAVLTQLEQDFSPDLAETFATKLAELLAQQQDENLKALAQMIQQEPAEKKGRFAKLKGFFERTDTALSILANGTALVTTLFPLVQQALTALGPEAASVLQSVRIYLQQVP